MGGPRDFYFIFRVPLRAPVGCITVKTLKCVWPAAKRVAMLLTEGSKLVVEEKAPETGDALSKAVTKTPLLPVAAELARGCGTPHNYYTPSNGEKVACICKPLSAILKKQLMHAFEQRHFPDFKPNAHQRDRPLCTAPHS